MGHGIWDMGYGIWDVGYGIWDKAYGIWYMGYGIWDMGFGILDMGYGIWDMGYGIWDMGYGICEKLTYGRISLYADDAKIFGEVNDISEWNRLQEDVFEVNNFLTAWQLKVNPNKSEVIHLGPNNAN